MCRLAAFPPGTPPDLAHEIIAACVRGNDDGVGSAYVKKGEIIVKKYPFSYQEAVTQRKDIFDHMPFKGWTIAHVRLATHGGNTINNTHPIVRGSLAVVHNGIFYGSGLVRAALSDSVKWQGETDSEVAAYMFNKLGTKGFFESMYKYATGAGVYLGLGKNGSLNVAKISGDLEIMKLSNDMFILASEFPYKMESRDVKTGYLEFGSEGDAKDFDFKSKTEEKWSRFRGGESQWEHGFGCRVSDSYTKRDVYVPNKTDTPAKTVPENRADSKDNSKATTSCTVKTNFGLWNWPDDEKAFELMNGLS